MNSHPVNPVPPVKTAWPAVRLGEIPPLAEQRRIVARLDALQAKVDALKRA